jgi:hypothetical protein
LYLIYLDESGTPLPSDPDPYYTVAGLLVCERDWKEINENVEKIKKTYNIREIKVERIYHHNKKRITKSIQTSSRSTAAEIIGEIYSLISRSNLMLFSVNVDKFKELKNNPTGDVEFLAWELLFERLNISIDRLCKISGVDEYGLIIMDEKDDDKDLRLRNYLRLLREQGTGYQIIDRIIEDPVFTPSHWRNLTQLADAVATCSKSYIKKDSFFTSQFWTIQDKFAKNKRGEIDNVGFKVW